MTSKYILIVDDSLTDFLYVKNILVRGGFVVEHASSGKEGIEMAKKNRPDCILMDVVMPEMNGFQATRTLTRNEITKHIPVVMLSSKTQQTDKVWAQRQGARDYVTKPPDATLLLKKIRSAIKSQN